MDQHNIEKHPAENFAKNSAIGLKAAVNILKKWKANPDQSMGILRVSRGTYFKAKKATMISVSLDSDQLTRVSFVLNMHQALRLVFDNPENIYGFMTMVNNNPGFNGKTPLGMMESGNITAVYETLKKIDALRGAQW